MKIFYIFLFLLFATNSYSLPKCIENEPIWDSCYGSFESSGPKGSSIYEGEWKNNLFHGRGLLSLTSGPGRGVTLFSEKWIKGDVAYGTKTWKNGDIYEGEIKNFESNGNGTYYYKNGAKFVGEWKNGKRQGKGVIIYDDKRIFYDFIRFEGLFENDKKKGYGTLFLRNGDKISGEFDSGSEIKILKNMTFTSVNGPKILNILGELENGTGKFTPYKYIIKGPVFASYRPWWSLRLLSISGARINYIKYKNKIYKIRKYLIQDINSYNKFCSIVTPPGSQSELRGEEVFNISIKGRSGFYYVNFDHLTDKYNIEKINPDYIYFDCERMEPM